jgi:release factor glutamine methyltransferase
LDFIFSAAYIPTYGMKPHTPNQTHASLGALLQQAQSAGLPRLEAQMLLLHSAGHSTQDRAWLLAHANDHASIALAEHFAQLCLRRQAGEPVAYLTQRKAFYGLDLHINPAVLDPRDDTETLVDWALHLLPLGSAAKVLDLGTGSGAIALAIQAQRPAAQVSAVDASEAALAVAQRNAQQLRLPVTLFHGSWYEPVADQQFHIILSNPPYIAQGDPHLQALQHEPLAALTSGEDGLDDIRHIIRHAPMHLHAGGHLLLEHGCNQGPAVAELLAQSGFIHIGQRQDLAGHIRCTGGQMHRHSVTPP